MTKYGMFCFLGDTQGMSRAMSTAFSGNYLSIENGPNGVAIVRLDDKTSKVNTISDKMTNEFVSMLDTIENDPSIKSVVLISSKVSGVDS